MIIHKEIRGMIEHKGLLDVYIPPTRRSLQWKNWKAIIDFKTCLLCVSQHGKIYALHEQPDKEPPIHWNCRCVIEAMLAVIAGQGTKDGNTGADWWLKNMGILPEYYITRAEIQALG